MRRGTRKALVQLTAFGSLLLLILYLNRPSSKNKTFAWNKIRYRTTATTLPEARGLCPGVADSSKPALVIARVLDDDVQWIDRVAEIYHPCVYTADMPLDKSSVHLQVPANRGHEAMAYLTFIVDNYQHIPAAGAVFVHGSRWAWHNDSPDYDNVALLNALNVSSAVAPFGYHNLRCDWSLSTCPPSAAPQGSMETSMQAMMDTRDARAVSDAALPLALVALFDDDEYAASESNPGVRLGRNDAVRAQCCAQFVVSRESIWHHSREEYVALRQWLLDGSKDGANDKYRQGKNVAPSDDRVAGRILSYVWHILFMQQRFGSGFPSFTASDRVDLARLNQLACPRADDCYCRLYGRCNPKGCTSPGRCSGEYRLPPNLKIPDDWAASHT